MFKVYPILDMNQPGCSRCCYILILVLYPNPPNPVQCKFHLMTDMNDDDDDENIMPIQNARPDLQNILRFITRLS